MIRSSAGTPPADEPLAVPVQVATISAKSVNATAARGAAPKGAESQRRRSPRRRSREYALQGLYQWLLAGGTPLEIAAHLATDEHFKRADRAFFQSVLSGAIDSAAIIDPIIATHIDRPLVELAPVEHAVLLLAGHELRSHIEAPWRVIVNEAIELSRSFGGTDGHKFVNGVLEKMARQLRPDEAWPQNST